MDKLYIADIPLEYCFADFHENYIDLYKQGEYSQNEVVDFYRLYFDVSPGTYQHMYRVIEEQTTSYLSYDVTNDWVYRSDVTDIFITVFLFIIFFIFLFNIVTSTIKKRWSFRGVAVMFKKIVIICSVITIFYANYSFGADSNVFVENSLIEDYNSRVNSVSQRFKLSVQNTDNSSIPTVLYYVQRRSTLRFYC